MKKSGRKRYQTWLVSEKKLPVRHRGAPDLTNVKYWYGSFGLTGMGHRFFQAFCTGLVIRLVPARSGLVVPNFWWSGA